MVEHAAVNRGVAGSSPARGARENISRSEIRWFRLRGQEVKTSPFHGGNTGSIPVGVTLQLKKVWCHSQAVRQRSATP